MQTAVHEMTAMPKTPVERKDDHAKGARQDPIGEDKKSPHELKEKLAKAKARVRTDDGEAVTSSVEAFDDPGNY